jgi:hypothetical protein
MVCIIVVKGHRSVTRVGDGLKIRVSVRGMQVIIDIYRCGSCRVSDACHLGDLDVVQSGVPCIGGPVLKLL